MWASAVIIIDATTRRIPNALTVPAVVATFGVCGLVGWGGVDQLWGISNPWAGVGGVAWWALIVAMGTLGSRWRAGAGDAKLALSLGVVAAGTGGVAGVLAVVFISGVLGALTAALPCVVGGAVRARTAKRVPQGPAMVLATAGVALWS